ncbi:efflux RND transporter permease subunit [Putridiphycobacter roseus]|uniref:efflux RND transporter permease subunit n=1 Tax=Putridiphycobacter roseus TaxID=2219161 RepID=UPI001314B8BA|nr:MMPL family transporter [Putridiphycobacter roseus]
MKNLKFDYDFTAFYAQNDPETQFFEAHKNRFGTDNDFVFMSIENDPSIFETDFLKKVAAFVAELGEDSLVKNVACLTNMSEYVKTPYSRLAINVPYLNICDTCDYYNDSLRIFSRPEIEAFFINQDATGMMVRIDHLEYLSKKKCDYLKQSIDQLIEKYGFEKYHLAGRAIGQSYYVDIMKFETLFFIGLSFILIILFLYIAFKSWWGIWLPLLIVSFSMLWIIGFMAAIDAPINIVLTVLPSIMFVVAMSDVIHLVSKYIEELRLGTPKNKAVIRAYKEVGFATLLTSVTTAIGFLSLLTVPMQAIKVFGIYTALGVLFAFFLAYTLLPALLILVKPPPLTEKKITQNFWYKKLHASFLFIIRNKLKLFWVFVLFIGVGIMGMLKVQNNYFLLEDLKEDNFMRQQFTYFDKAYMGLRPFELSVELVDSNKTIFDYEVLRSINRIDSFLESDYGLNQTFSLAKVFKIANRIEHAGQSKYYQFPNEAATAGFLKTLLKLKDKSMLGALVDSSQHYTRISSTMGDIGKIEADKKTLRLHQFIKSEIDSTLIRTQITGTGHILDTNMASISFNLTLGLLMAILIVSLLMGFLYKNLKMVLIALVPNILPLLFLAAILGYLGIDLKVSTAIIFTIAFGIAVDDTIHFMSKFKLELNKGKPFLYALKRTYLSTGRAIILTTLIICAGFLLLLFSDFLGTFYIGLLISLTLVFALLADLVLLPVLILLFYGKKS